ncbi:helix-turn-helix domain-containing protein [Aeoliella mucimassa]|nr:helix-turn-helix domain-containing protein [Aeoliella mucimassa]
MADPRGVATFAAKKLGLLGHGRGELLARAGWVETAADCAAVLVDCLASLPSDGPADPDTLSPSDVARILGVDADTVRGWIRNNELRAANIANGNRPRWIITRQELDSFLANRQEQPTTARRASRF